MSDMTAPRLIWEGFGASAPEGKTGAKYAFEGCEGVCATCCHPIASGVPAHPRRGVTGILNATFSGHAEYLAHGTHVCAGCAWMYGQPKISHRAVLTLGGRSWWPTISQDMEGRPKWREILREASDLPPDAPMTGVLTTDPKPRFWPRVRLASIARPGLYVHWPDFDISRWVDFEFAAFWTCLGVVDEARALGMTKRECMLGGCTSRLVDKRGIVAVMDMEARLAALRPDPSFSIAVVLA